MMYWLRAFTVWLQALPWQLFVLALAGLALNAASDLGNTFGSAPRFGGPWVAWGTLLAFLAFFALALLALAWRTTDPREWVSSPQRSGAQIGLSINFARVSHVLGWSLRYLLAVFVLWTALQSLVVIARMPRTLASPKSYGSDEMFYAHYNAWLVLHGRNPYVGDHLAGALNYFHVDNVTLIRVGRYHDPLQPPTKAQTQAIVAAYLADPRAPHPQLESATTHSYPAFSFLIALPSVWAGLPTLGGLQVIGLLALLLAIITLAPLRWRIPIATLCLLDVDGIRSVAGSDFAIWTVAGMALVWILGSGEGTGTRRATKITRRIEKGTKIGVGARSIAPLLLRDGTRRARNSTEGHGGLAENRSLDLCNMLRGYFQNFRGFSWLSCSRPLLAAIALGMVCAVQQTAWFFAPFYLLWVWRGRGWQAAVREGAVAVGVFALINLPWMVASPGAWLHSLWLPMTLPLFPTGGGLVGLGLGGALPLWPSGVYTALELLAFGGLLAAYARWGARLPFAGLLLPLLPILLAWRSPSRYFILLPLLALLAVVLQWRAAPPDPAPAHPPAAG